MKSKCRSLLFTKLTYSLILMLTACAASATPANLKATQRYFGRFLPKKLANCSLCHLPLQPGKSPDSLLSFPHNAFGNRIKIAGEELRKTHLADCMSARLTKNESEGSDGDGLDNLSEILLGTSPENGDRIRPCRRGAMYKAERVAPYQEEVDMNEAVMLKGIRL